ncbi:Oligopeptide-binding protein AppA [Xylophilus ampelinus]|nr:ABC transporter substrate-binding protein [Variovorax sp.]VTY27803.1 Oligopeptide-binding protein AppA [Xylophilus ampelinus]
MRLSRNLTCRLGMVLLSAAMMAAAPAHAQKKGGDAVVAQQAQPPSLDAMTTSAQAARNINLHIYEGLFARSDKGETIPDLAESFTAAANGLDYTIKLRKGVKFHNGQVMTATDVKASLERYAKVGGSAQNMALVQSITVIDPSTIAVKMKAPYQGFIEFLGSPRAPAVIIPASEAAKEAGKIAVIGTGPYKMVEYRPDSFIKLARFDDYVPNPAYKARDGLGGRKTPYLDTVTFRFIPEAGARNSALEAGEVQVLEQISPTAARRMKSNTAVASYEMMPWSFQTIFLNANVAPTNNVKVRQAIMAALENEEIMAISTDGLYRMTHGWQHPGTPYYAGDVGKPLYNQHNVEKAKALLKESGYKGEELVFIADNGFKNHNDTAVIATQQLKAIGMNVRLQVTDWPTTFAARAKPDGWNLFPIMIGIEPYEGPVSVGVLFTGDNNWQHKKDPELEAAMTKLTTAASLDERKAAFATMQARIYDQAYAIKVGDVGIYEAASARLKNFAPHRIPRMWDVWFD